ncbi:transketolase [Geobacter sp.]|uniref:transketolase n=1 Tax=Geobacter sp. TaxID=46610 RepID=UPI002602926C|nr:transketolase [Geobacter sp.]
MEKTNGMTMEHLRERAQWVRRETLKIHGIAPETRVASSLSDVEIFVALYYGNLLRFEPSNPLWPGRDRLIISKGHGSISLYPILADLGYFDRSELERVCREGSILGGIPDTMIPGYETINGSLGHGLGVACGMALALRRQGSDAHVFVLVGDGELYEGSVWEAVMFAAHHNLGNLTAIIDNNKICMLDLCSRVIDLQPLEQKFSAFNWHVDTIDGHDIEAVMQSLTGMKRNQGRPKVVIADTVKGKGVPSLEHDTLCHIKSLSQAEIAAALEELQ